MTKDIKLQLIVFSFTEKKLDKKEKLITISFNKVDNKLEMDIKTESYFVNYYYTIYPHLVEILSTFINATKKRISKSHFKSDVKYEIYRDHVDVTEKAKSVRLGYRVLLNKFI